MTMMAPALMSAGDTRLVLLGTHGGPRPNPARSNPANLLITGSKPYVIDCGHDVTRQLMAAGLPLNQVRTILITHHHSDHTLELGPLIYNAWIAGLREPIDIWVRRYRTSWSTASFAPWHTRSAFVSTMKDAPTHGS
jgi:ribonuclease BN (tRNA processing enzyme)